jgi:hypothetical protein
MTDTSKEAVERFARRIETREPYKSAIQIACEEEFSGLGGTVGGMIVVLGQGDYPTIQNIADRMTADANQAAKILRALLAERDELIDKYCDQAVRYSELADRLVAMTEGAA